MKVGKGLGVAGDWIKMRTALATDRAVMVICDLTGLDEFAVVGRLHAIWVWAGEHTVTGEVRGVTQKTIDRVTRCEKFSDAMIAAQWLEVIPEGGVRFVRWKKHNTKAARERALAADRQAKQRAKSHARNRDGQRDASVTNHATEKRREEKSKNIRNKDITSNSGLISLPTLIAKWNAIQGITTCIRATAKRKTAFASRAADPQWASEIDAALSKVAASDFCTGKGNQGWRADLEWFLRPDTVTRLLEGKYDNGTKHSVQANDPSRVRQRDFKAEFGDRHYQPPASMPGEPKASSES